jgi:CshA-type fibril repeat protein
VLGVQGTATPGSFRLTDAFSQTASSTYTPTVTPPAPPTAPSLSSTSTVEAPSAPQTVEVPIPLGGAVTLLDSSGVAATTVVVPGQGTYVLDPTTGRITFTPVEGFGGPVTPVALRVTDPYGQSATGSYSPEIAARPVTTTPPRTATGTPSEPPSITLTIPPGGSATLIGPNGEPTNEVTIAGQGTYRLDPSTGVLVFVAEAGFTGTPDAVTYRITDAEGNQTLGTFQPTVLGADVGRTAGAPRSPAAGRLAFTGGTVGLLLRLGAMSLLLGLVLVRRPPRLRVDRTSAG